MTRCLVGIGENLVGIGERLVGQKVVLVVSCGGWHASMITRMRVKELHAPLACQSLVCTKVPVLFKNVGGELPR